MTTPTKFFFVSIVAAFGLMAIPLSAQEEQGPPASGTILIEQKSEVDAVSKWTMIQPNHESFDRTDASLSMPNMIPGKYTLLVAAPKGTSTPAMGGARGAPY